MRRAKIIATLGPAVSSPEVLSGLITAGVDVFRMNLSHGQPEVHEELYFKLRRQAGQLSKHVAIFADLQGPKIRLGRFAAGPYILETGNRFSITTEEVLGTSEICSTTFARLPENVSPGDLLLVDDGKVALRCLSNDGVVIATEVEIGGPVSNNKGINLPGVPVNIAAMCEKDEEDLRWALRLGVDLVALSFVRSAKDLESVRRIMAEQRVNIPVIAKIEKPQAVEKIEEIVLAYDAIMVARGDLGVELPLEEVPVIQKQIIEASRSAAKPVIVATQMLESMITCPRPTRAEAGDVANAILDGADAVMLSAETSVGEWPIETVKTMAKIIEATETKALDRIRELTSRPKTVGGAVCWAAARIAELVEAKYLCVFSESGDSIRRVSRLRHRIPIVAFSPDLKTVRQVSMSWGVDCFLVEHFNTTDQMTERVDRVLLANNLARIGDKVVVISGSPLGIPGSTNHIRVHVLGNKADI